MAGLLVNLVLTNIFLLGLTGLALRYGRPTGSRWIDRLNRFITVSGPSRVMNGIGMAFGKSAIGKIERLMHYVVNEPNPLTMILYLVLAVGGYIAFVVSGYPHLDNTYHREVGFLLFLGSLFFFLRAASSDPGIITHRNHAYYYSMFPFDGAVFRKGVLCESCKFAKPARAKHCRVDNQEVARFDHHCVWINQCVGLGNQKPFLLFLLFNNVMCLYGGYLGTAILVDIVESQGLRNVWFRDAVTGQRYQSSTYYVLVYLLAHEMILCYVTILAGLMGVVLVGFTWYHWVTLMRRGPTTNERSKVSTISGTPAEARFFKTYSNGSWWANLKHVWSLSVPK